jgi:hypothetical protein
MSLLYPLLVSTSAQQYTMSDQTLDPSLLDTHFHHAATYLSSTPATASLPNETKLEIYALYKIATIGPEPFVSPASLCRKSTKY